MLKSQCRWLLPLAAFGSVLLLLTPAHAQDAERHSRKYVPPPETAHVSVSVIKDANGKAIENAAVIFHMVGEEGKGNMELKTNEEGKAAIDVIPIGDTVRLQVIASGFQTFGDDFKINSDTREIVVRMKRPGKQYSTYDHPAAAQAGASTAPAPAAPAPK